MITLKTLPDATAQEVFDQVSNHLLTQNEKSGGSYKCMYKTIGKINRRIIKCAAGCLISDEEYDKDMENKSWNGLVAGDYGIPDTHEALIVNLQKVHDEYNVGEWAARLEQLAKEQGLKFNIL